MARTKGSDASLGQQVRARRKFLGLTQADLAAAMGISFQQVQKYEKGLSSISPGRMEQICEIMHLPQGYFDVTENLIGKPANRSADDANDTRLVAFANSVEGRRLIDAYLTIYDAKLRTTVLDFMAAIARDQ